MLTPSQWAQALSWLKARDEEVIFLGGSRNREAADRIIGCLKQCFPEALLINRCGQLSLLGSVAYIDSSDEFWAIDSALLHYARLLGKRTVSFWGPTDPQTGLKEDKSLLTATYYMKTLCSPCIHVAEAPPCRGRNICIESIFDPSKAELAHQGILVSEK